MARKKNEVTVIEETEMPGQVAERMNEAHNDLVAKYDRAVLLAGSLGYQGAVTVDALEGEIRFYQRRTVEAILETGKRLLVLKELTPHGEFIERVQALGFAERTARRFMQTAIKVSKSANLAVLSKEVKSASAFLELVTHDDDADLEKLAELDDIEKMSASQVRERLRELQAEREATQKVLDGKNKQLDKLQADLNRERYGKLPPDEKQHELSARLAAAALGAEQLVSQQLKTAIANLLAHAEELGDTKSGTALAAGCVMQVQQALNDVRDEFELPAFQNYVPDWYAASKAEQPEFDPVAPVDAGDMNLFDLAEEVDPKTFNA